MQQRRKQAPCGTGHVKSVMEGIHTDPQQFISIHQTLNETRLGIVRFQTDECRHVLAIDLCDGVVGLASVLKAFTAGQTVLQVLAVMMGLHNLYPTPLRDWMAGSGAPQAISFRRRRPSFTFRFSRLMSSPPPRWAATCQRSRL